MTTNKNIFVNYGSQILNSFFALVLSIYIARVLGPENRGDLTIYNNSVILLGTWLSLSLNSSLVYFINSKIVETARVVNTILLFSIISTILALLIAKLATFYNFGWMILPLSYQTTKWILLFAFHYLITQLIVFTNGILNAKYIFIPQSIFNTIITLLSVIVWMTIYYNKKKIDFGFAASTTIFLSLPPLLFNLYLIFTKTSTVFGFKFVNLIQLKKLLKYSLFVFTCNALQILTYRMDLWFMKFHHGSSETGIYSLSVNMAQLVWILPGSISAVLYSELSKENTLEEKIKVVNKYSKLALYTSLFLSFCLFILYYFFGALLYGQKFIDSRIYLGVLLFGIAPFSITTIIATFNAATNNIKYNFWTTFWGLIAATLFCFLLIPKFGALGASIATVIAYNSCNIYILFIYKKRMKVNLRSLLITKHDLSLIKIYIKKRINAKS
jgi:O-antigen/teichoic acid export membrane protein